MAADTALGLQEAVVEAASDQRPLRITAGGTKTHAVGRDCEGTPLNVGGHTGIIDYQPSELMLQARAGTPVAELAAAVASEGQVLPFEPPRYGGNATLGGTLACNLSGPGRPWLGSIRDATMGVGLINGRGEQLALGGKVMKNVAGYDASRLQAGALGCLGLITDVTLKVVPAPEQTLTLTFEMDAQQALQTMSEKAATPRPLTAACWLDGRLYLRLAGAASAVQATAASWGGETLTAEHPFWADLRDMSLPFFKGDQPLWRQSTRATEPLQAETGCLIDWAGQQRWYRSSDAPAVEAGHVVLFAGGDRNTEVRGELDPVQQRLQLRLKQTFDPQGIFNPGRLYSWM
ncbi:glycolate oxidase subunit GlcE [Halioglobus sp. HI00S01]|uniref:glycolate oxidase subunit GlcE n=1 Tax=Halioglobus sp. HI00S01 TaxID=1822214 RepID=UPI0007C3D0C2|nr:glycolate oxidase subunit GlcE [Halioglobus sp. HI00S01]KZX58772.1 glycolate oxidase subunit GlcE [Halioglobus sp. HI00S01]